MATWFTPSAAYYDAGPPPAEGEILASLETEFTPWTAFVELTASTSGQGTASGSAIAKLDYSYMLNQNNAPPIYTPFVPTRFQGHAEGSLSGSGGFTASIQLNTTGGGFYSWGANEYVPEFSVDQLLWLPPDGNVLVHLLADCNVVASGAGGGFVPYSQCSAAADPTLVLDQEAFDTAMGANTYRLADYWSLEASPNPIPEPANLFLAGLGLAAIALGAAKRRRIH